MSNRRRPVVEPARATQTSSEWLTAITGSGLDPDTKMVAASLARLIEEHGAVEVDGQLYSLGGVA